MSNTTTVSPIINVQSTKEDEKKKLDDERKNAALAYLNITKGKFESKSNKTGIDNVAPVDNKSDLSRQTQDNINRLNNSFSSSNKELTIGTNPFKSMEVSKQTSIDSMIDESKDIYDEKFTKKEFTSNFDSYSKSNNSLNNAFSNLTKMAEKVYSGDVKENLVEAQGNRVTQVTMIDPVVKNKPVQKTG